MIDLHEAVAEMFSATAWPEFSRVWSHLGLYDPHPDADAWLTGDEETRARIQARLAERPLSKLPERRKRRYVPRQDMPRSRGLAAVPYKLTPALRDKVLALTSQGLSQRVVALQLHLSRPTVARALGKEWAKDHRVARTRKA